MMKCPNPFPFFAALGRTHLAWAVAAGSLFLMLAPSAAAQPAVPHDLQVDRPMLHSLRLAWTGGGGSETGFVIERSWDGVNFGRLYSVAPNVTTFTDDWADPDTTYWYRVRSSLYVRTEHGDTETYSNPSNVAVGRTLVEAPLLAWGGHDVGSPTLSGSESSPPPALTMNAAGTDIFGTADTFRYACETRIGDLTIIARVDSMAAANTWAKAGVMIRASLKADSANAAMLLTAGNACVFQTRGFGAEPTASASGAWFNAPAWVKLTRVGNLFSGYISPDGVAWQPVGSQEIAMPGQVYVGVAGCSHNSAARAAMAFSGIALAGASTEFAAPANFKATTVTAHGAHLTWTDNSTVETGFRIWYGRNEGGAQELTLLGTTGPNATSFDATLTSDTPYVFVLAAIRDADQSDPRAINVRTPQAADEPPYAPTHMEAYSYGSRGLVAAWNNPSTTATGFELERATAGGPFTLIQTFDERGYSYWDHDLTAGTVYTYRIRAVNAAGYSDYSPVASATPIAAPNAPTGLAIDGSTDTTLHLSWTDTSNDETGFILRRWGTSTGGFASFVLPANTTSYTDTGLTPGTSYTYDIYAEGTPYASDLSNTVVGSTTAGPPPAAWTGRDIGNPTSTGSDSGSVPTVTMNAGGADIFGTADSFHSLFSSVDGDTTVVTRVTAMTNTNAWAKAGVMIRAGLGADAPNAAMLLTAANVCVFQARTTAGAATTSTSGGWFNAPYWVKLTRVANTFSGYVSRDGVSWTLVGTQDIAMPAQVYIGLAGSSHNAGAQTAISFANVAVTATATTLAAPSSLHSSSVTAHGAHLTWTDNSGDEDGFRIYAENDEPHAGFRLVGTTAANVTSADLGLESNTHYYVVVAAVRGTTESWSDAIMVTTLASDTPPPPPPSGWSGHDIGNPGSTGSDSGSAPTVSMIAGGADIFGGADSFHGLFSSATGDTTVVARVASMTNTHPWAKAGVMIRAGLEANAPNAAMLLTAGNVCVFQARTSAGGDTASTSGGWFNAPYWVKLTRAGNTFSGFISPDGANWTLIGTQEIAMPAQVYLGLAGSSHNPGAQTTLAFEGVAVTGAPPPPPPPADWTRVAWNAGSSSTMVHEGGDAIIIRGKSGDIWDRSDSGTFMYRPVTSDDLLTVRVDQVTFADSFSKGGLMFRATLEADSPNVSVVATPSYGLIFQVRDSAGAVTTSVREVRGVTAPVRLWLGRTANRFLAAYSTDEGATWTPLGEVTVAMPPNAYLGVVGASHNPTFESSAAFSNITPR